MIAQDSSISQASKAAGNFLASGSSLESFNNLSKANMFSAKEQTTASVNRESLLGGDTKTASELSSIKAGEDKIAGTNLNKQTSAVGLNEGSLFNNAQNMKNFETNVVSGATDDGVKTEKLVGGGSSTTSYTPIGKIQQTLDSSENVVQSSTDGSHKTDTSNIKKADNIDTANNTFERINKTDTSNIKKADNIDTADTLISRNNTDTANNIKERKNTTNLDDSFSNMITTKYTDTSTGEQITQYWKDKNRTDLMGQEKFGIDKDGELKLTQVWDKEKGWVDVKSSHDGSHKTDKSVQEDYSKIFKNNKIHEEQVLENYKKLQDYSNTANYEVGNKNANNYAAAMALQALPIEYQKAVLSNMVAGDTIMESVSKVPGVSALAPTIQSFMADVQAKKAINDIDGVKDTVGAYTHAVDNLFSKVPAKDAIQETSAIKAEIIGKVISK
jgi:hypothetical protein